MKILTVLFALFILLVIVLADLGKLPRPLHAVYDFPNGDKVGHFVLFGLLNFFLTLTFIRSSPDQSLLRVTVIVGLLLALLIALEEFSQRFFVNRTSDLIDLLASYMGLSVGGWVAMRIHLKW